MLVCLFCAIFSSLCELYIFSLCSMFFFWFFSLNIWISRITNIECTSLVAFVFDDSRLFRFILYLHFLFVRIFCEKHLVESFFSVTINNSIAQRFSCLFSASFSHHRFLLDFHIQFAAIWVWASGCVPCMFLFLANNFRIRIRVENRISFRLHILSTCTISRMSLSCSEYDAQNIFRFESIEILPKHTHPALWVLQNKHTEKLTNESWCCTNCSRCFSFFPSCFEHRKRWNKTRNQKYVFIIIILGDMPKAKRPAVFEILHTTYLLTAIWLTQKLVTKSDESRFGRLIKKLPVVLPFTFSNISISLPRLPTFVCSLFFHIGFLDCIYTWRWFNAYFMVKWPKLCYASHTFAK